MPSVPWLSPSQMSVQKYRAPKPPASATPFRTSSTSRFKWPLPGWLSHEAYLKHFINDLHQEIPLWAYVDLLTISDISFLYSISERPIKETIAHRFGLTMNRGPEILGQYMHSMTIIRNLCAHGSRIYNRLFEQKPSLNKKEQALLIRREDGTMDNAHFFGFFLIMRRLLPAENFAEMKEAVIALTEKYPFVRMDYYGFRDDWKEKL